MNHRPISQSQFNIMTLRYSEKFGSVSINRWAQDANHHSHTKSTDSIILDVLNAQHYEMFGHQINCATLPHNTHASDKKKQPASIRGAVANHSLPIRSVHLLNVTRIHTHTHTHTFSNDSSIHSGRIFIGCLKFWRFTFYGILFFNHDEKYNRRSQNKQLFPRPKSRLTVNYDA